MKNDECSEFRLNEQSSCLRPLSWESGGSMKCFHHWLRDKRREYQERQKQHDKLVHRPDALPR